MPQEEQTRDDEPLEIFYKITVQSLSGPQEIYWLNTCHRADRTLSVLGRNVVETLFTCNRFYTENITLIDPAVYAVTCFNQAIQAHPISIALGRFDFSNDFASGAKFPAEIWYVASSTHCFVKYLFSSKQSRSCSEHLDRTLLEIAKCTVPAQSSLESEESILGGVVKCYSIFGLFLMAVGAENASHFHDAVEQFETDTFDFYTERNATKWRAAEVRAVEKIWVMLSDTPLREAFIKENLSLIFPDIDFAQFSLRQLVEICVDSGITFPQDTRGLTMAKTVADRALGYTSPKKIFAAAGMGHFPAVKSYFTSLGAKIEAVPETGKVSLGEIAALRRSLKC